ncbi:MAG: hypothetical protein R2701_12620 [Acidimicrobiales bacterium]
MVFITAGKGGGTSARAPRPVIAEIAKGIGALTIGVVTARSPSRRRRSVQAEAGIQRLKEKVDTQIVIPNDRLLAFSNEKTSMINAFKMADSAAPGRAGGSPTSSRRRASSTPTSPTSR